MFVNFGAASSLAAELGNRTSETLTGTFANVIDQSNNCIIKNSVVLGSVKLEFGNNFTIINGKVSGLVEAKGDGVVISGAQISGEVKGTDVKLVKILDGEIFLSGLSLSKCTGPVTVMASDVSLTFAEEVGDLSVTGSNIGVVTLTKPANALHITYSFVEAGGVLVAESGLVAVTNSKVDGSFIVEKGNGARSLTFTTPNEIDQLILSAILVDVGYEHSQCRDGRQWALHVIISVGTILQELQVNLVVFCTIMY